jgi:hypothetical protein
VDAISVSVYGAVEQSNLPMQILTRQPRNRSGLGITTFLKVAEIDIVPLDGFRKMSLSLGDVDLSSLQLEISLGDMLRIAVPSSGTITC